MSKSKVPRSGKPVSFRIPDDLYGALDEIKTRDGILLSEQLRRALVLWVRERLPERAGKQR